MLLASILILRKRPVNPQRAVNRSSIAGQLEQSPLFFAHQRDSGHAIVTGWTLAMRRIRSYLGRMMFSEHAGVVRHRVMTCAFAVAIAGAGFFATTMTHAASPWTTDTYVALRLLNAGPADSTGATPGTTRLAALEMKLKPGWKTYWRMPGDSGVPPRFDFSKSENVADVAVLWPAPHVFADGNGGKSVGYHEGLVLPLRVTLKDPHARSTLRVAIQYGVCEKLCVPGEASLEIGMDAQAGDDASLIAKAMSQVPRTLSHDVSSVRAVVRDGDGKRALIDIASAAAPDAVLVEGPTPEWALPIPALIPASMDDAPNGVRRFVFALEGAPPGQTYENLTLRITILSAGRAEETQITLK